MPFRLFLDFAYIVFGGPAAGEDLLDALDGLDAVEDLVGANRDRGDSLLADEDLVVAKRDSLLAVEDLVGCRHGGYRWGMKKELGEKQTSKKMTLPKGASDQVAILPKACRHADAHMHTFYWPTVFHQPYGHTDRYGIRCTVYVYR
jgi:hypothetical protein